MTQQYQIGNYEETYKNFRLTVPERYNWAYEVFDRWGNDPSKLAIVWVGQDGSSREVTFRELAENGLGAPPMCSRAWDSSPANGSSSCCLAWWSGGRSSWAASGAGSSPSQARRS